MSTRMPDAALDLEPTDADAAATSLGVPPIRLQLIRYLSANGPATVSKIGRDLCASRNGVRRHLDALAEIGLVLVEYRRVEGSFRPAACYFFDAARAESVAALVAGAITVSRPRSLTVV